MNIRKAFWVTVCCLTYAVIGAKSSVAVEVSAERSEQGAIVRIDGELFAEYLILSGHQPAIWPIIGPTGKPMTRSFPIGPLGETEKDDHPHHHSLWFAHEDVNGHNFWVEPSHRQAAGTSNVIKHVDFVKIDSKGSQAVLVTRNQWLAGKDNLICEDERTVVFGANAKARWIDYTTKILATNGPVTFADIKDGTFSIRVAGSMKVDSGGTILNNVGQKNSEAWGMPAEWVDYHGPLEGETVGAAIFSHPANFRHPCRWHVRDYGLFCANPFGDHQFPKADIKQSSQTIPAGESLTLRYRVYLHRGDTAAANIATVYQKFIADRRVGASATLLFEDDFEQGMDDWVASDARLPETVWEIGSVVDGRPNSYLRVTGASKYQPPHRSPHSIALVKDIVVRDFELTAKVQNTNVKAGNHRDLCFFWGYQDPAHFYYVHLGAKPDPHSSQIFIVDGSARKMITTNTSSGIPWSEDWHNVKVSHDSDSGLMQVYFDDMAVPVLTAQDKTFTWGRVGVGTFDDHGNFDNLKLYGDALESIPDEAKLP